jgi:hypothetical protein
LRKLLGGRRAAGDLAYKWPVRTENLIRVDDLMESPKLTE